MKKYIISSVLVIVVTVLDQISKLYLISHLKTQDGYLINVTWFFDLVYAWNYGASFGIFKQYYQYSNYAFLLLNSIIVAYLIYIILKSTKLFEYASLSMVAGGALGNIIDRILHGAVFDFLYFHYEDYSFPAFNLADSAISVGAFIYLINYFIISQAKRS